MGIEEQEEAFNRYSGAQIKKKNKKAVVLGLQLQNRL